MVEARKHENKKVITEDKIGRERKTLRAEKVTKRKKVQ